MPIIAKIGRKHPRVRALILLMYALLIAGSVTMVYPFMLMISGSMKSEVDRRTMNVIPGFLKSDTALYQKHMEGLFNETMEFMMFAYDLDVRSFGAVLPPEQPNQRLVDAWTGFIKEKTLPSYAYAVGNFQTRMSRTVSKALREFKTYLQEIYSEDLNELNRQIGTEFYSWNAVGSVGSATENFLTRRNKPSDTKFGEVLNDFKQTQPIENTFYFSAEGYYKKIILKARYTKNINEYNRTHGTAYQSYDQVRLSRYLPVGSATEKEDWENFVRNNLNLLWIRVRPTAAPVYHDFLGAKFQTIQALNKLYKTSYASFDDVPLIEEPPLSGLALSDWEAIIAGWRDPITGKMHLFPTEVLVVHSIDFMFRDHLRGTYRTIEEVNRELGTAYAAFEDIRLPQRDWHYLDFLKHRRAIAWEFATRNYKTVIEYIVIHGRGLINTVIYCAMAIFFALLVNPLAAYALSRYSMPGAYKILLFLMLTMAFPVMVTQIPSFLMMRQFGMLNTFWALVLPTVANGYFIFLLKGFFDSLPRELYESATLDGANEWIMFWIITMNLSKPILAVIALTAFTGAYTNFMFAFIICQDEKMWTLMVWLYQLQQRSGDGVMYASLIIAAIPTFLIFLFCQNIIMRGIVVPMEK